MDNFDKGNELYKKELYLEAIKAYKDDLEDNKNNSAYMSARSYHNIGVCYIKLKDNVKGIEYETYALRSINKNNSSFKYNASTYAYNIGFAYLNLGNIKTALVAFYLAQSINPQLQDLDNAIKLALNMYKEEPKNDLTEVEWDDMDGDDLDAK